MKKKEQKLKKKYLIIQNKMLNNKNKEYITYNINKPSQKLSYHINSDIFIPKYNNSVSYTKPKILKLFSEDLKKNNLLRRENKHRKIKTEILSDKIIQTPADFIMSSKRGFFDKSHNHLNIPIKKVKINYKVFPNNDIIKNKNKKNVFSLPSKSMSTTRPIFKHLNFKKEIKSRNKLSPAVNFKKIINYKNIIILLIINLKIIQNDNSIIYIKK